MNGLNHKLLQEVVMHVLEDCAFMCTQLGPESQVFPEQITRATLAFKGPRSGKLELFAARELAMSIAADMLGIDAADPDATSFADGALGEISNIITGALVARLFGTECLVELGIPVVDHVVPGPKEGESCALKLTDMEGRAIDVRFSLESAS
ncbi:MAG: chemotaxis protein CheX [Pseudomonadota bacterium]